MSSHKLFSDFQNFQENKIHLNSVYQTGGKGDHIPLCNHGRWPLGGSVPHETTTVTTSLQIQNLFNYPRFYLLHRASKLDDSASEHSISYDQLPRLSLPPFKQQLDRICEAHWACIVLLSSKGTEWGWIEDDVCTASA